MRTSTGRRRDQYW